jgi:hypothetical protein
MEEGQKSVTNIQNFFHREGEADRNSRSIFNDVTVRPL